MTFSVVTTGGRALGIFIIPICKRGFYHPPFGKGGRGGIAKSEQGEKGSGVASSMMMRCNYFLQRLLSSPLFSFFSPRSGR